MQLANQLPKTPNTSNLTTEFVEEIRSLRRAKKLHERVTCTLVAATSDDGEPK
jgi:hypothetical protein